MRVSSHVDLFSFMSEEFTIAMGLASLCCGGHPSLRKTEGKLGEREEGRERQSGALSASRTVLVAPAVAAAAAAPTAAAPTAAAAMVAAGAAAEDSLAHLPQPVAAGAQAKLAAVALSLSLIREEDDDRGGTQHKRGAEKGSTQSKREEE